MDLYEPDPNCEHDWFLGWRLDMCRKCDAMRTHEPKQKHPLEDVILGKEAV